MSPSDEVRDFALGTLSMWLHGYDTPEGGPQRRYRVVAEAEDGRSLDVQVEVCDPFPSDPQVFRVWLEVEQL
nr:hypothetical protein OG513_07710 [Streptomyces sp. NBC_00998]